MAREHREFDVTIPAGTLATAPLVTSLAMPSRSADTIKVRFPPGPSGYVGCRLASAGTQIVPWNVGSWLVADDHVFEFQLTNLITSGAWQLIAYNTGTYPHTLYVEFYLSVVQQAGLAALPAPIDTDLLSGTTGLPN